MTRRKAPKPDGARPGRPAKRESETRAERVAFRVTQDEADRLQIAADRAGVTVSEYCRAAALGARLRARKERDVSSALVELNRVGVNLNQIARALNRGTGLPSDLSEVLDEVRAAVERLAGGER